MEGSGTRDQEAKFTVVKGETEPSGAGDVIPATPDVTSSVPCKMGKFRAKLPSKNPGALIEWGVTVVQRLIEILRQPRVSDGLESKFPEGPSKKT